MWAVVRVRGAQRSDRKIKRTLELLRLKDKNNCVVLPEEPRFKGMLERVKDFVTWGEIDDATLAELMQKRGAGANGYRGVAFRLAPPRKGFERKGAFKRFGQGGALGYRGKEINRLLKRMI